MLTERTRDDAADCRFTLSKKISRGKPRTRALRDAAVTLYGGERRGAEDTHLAEVTSQWVAEAAVRLRQQLNSEGAERLILRQPGLIECGLNLGGRPVNLSFDKEWRRLLPLLSRNP